MMAGQKSPTHTYIIFVCIYIYLYLVIIIITIIIIYIYEQIEIGFGSLTSHPREICPAPAESYPTTQPTCIVRQTLKCTIHKV